MDYKDIYEKIKNNWDAIAKPLDSLGRLEEIVCKIGAIQSTELPTVDKSAVIILCSDNGIVEEGVSQSDQSVTRICTENIAAKKTTVGIMAEQSNTDVLVYDLGIASTDKLNNVTDYKIRYGTRNFLLEPAMTQEETEKAISIGKKIVKNCKTMGYNILCIGEMGIGNTTTSSAIAASLLKCKAEDVTGKGAGLDDKALIHKKEVIQSAIDKHHLYEKDALTILQYVGGYDIAGMVGIYLGAKEYNIPIVIDGAISMVAALVAENIQPNIIDYLIPSHKSREPLVKEVMKKLNINPVIDANMALGEGTGAVLMLSIIKTAIAVYKKSVPFSQSGVEQYKRY